MSEREELSRIMRREYTRAIDRKRVADCFDAPADAILAAGYTKRRTVATVEELDALPVGSKLYSTGTHDVWWKRNRSRGGPWWQGSCGMFSRHDDFLDSEAPLVVLHAPEPQP